MRKFLSAYFYFFLRIRKICVKYLGAYEECGESIYAYMENTANVGLFAVLKIVSEYAESFNRIRRIRRKNLYVYGKYRKSLSAYSLTTPRDIKVCISQLIITKILTFFRFFLSTLYGMT
jgi:hypothetical protein